MALGIPEFIRAKGYDFTPENLDGKFHEIKTDRGKVWYKGKTFKTESGREYNDFKFGNYKEAVTYALPLDKSLFTKKEQKEIETRLNEERVYEETERAKLQEEKSCYATKEIKDLEADDGSTSYAKKKQIGPIPGALLRTNPLGEKCLVIPMKDSNGKIWNFQSITPSDKTFVDGGKMAGTFFQLGQIHGLGTIYLTEGVATAMSIFLAKNKLQNEEKSAKISEKAGNSVEKLTKVDKKPEKIDKYPQFAVISCFNGGNLCEVARTLRIENPDARIVVCSDNDNHSTKENNRSTLKNNPGLRYATKAAHVSKATILIPDFSYQTYRKPEERKPNLSDFNDLHVDVGLDRVAVALSKHRNLGPEQIIFSEHNGFHKIVRSGNNRLIHEPQYIDMSKWLEREQPFVVQSESEQVYLYSGKKYVDTHPSQIKEIAQQKFWVEYEENCNNHMANEFHGLVKRTNVKELDWFNSSIKETINFQNGILDTRSMKLVDHSPKRGFRTVLEYDYDPDALCPNFEKLLENVTVGDSDLRQMLLEFMGYVLSTDRPTGGSFCKALVCIGQGSNGKSTFFNILTSLVGDDNTSHVPIAGFVDKQQMFLLDGKTLNVCEESDDKAFFKSGDVFKNAVSGGKIQAKKLYSQPYSFQNKAKIVLSYNTFPRANDPSHGFMRRFLFANFNAEFDESKPGFDPNIESKCLDELSGIFNLAWAAYTFAKKRGRFTVPASSKSTLEEFQTESDSVKQYMDDFIDIVNGDWEPRQDLPKWCHLDPKTKRPFAVIDELYLEYHEWAKTMGMQPLNHIHFTRRFRQLLDRYRAGFSEENGRRTVFNGTRCRIMLNVTRCSAQ